MEYKAPPAQPLPAQKSCAHQMWWKLLKDKEKKQLRDKGSRFMGEEVYNCGLMWCPCKKYTLSSWMNPLKKISQIWLETVDIRAAATTAEQEKNNKTNYGFLFLKK